jgi:hypothetical protein
LPFTTVAIDDHAGMRAVAKWLHEEIVPYVHKLSTYGSHGICRGYDKRTGASVRVSAEVLNVLDKF